MSLKDWEERNRWLVAFKPTMREIGDLLAVGERDLKDSRAEGLSADSRMTLGYNAALQAASAALAACGYRPARGGDHHYRVLQSLTLTIGWDIRSVNRLDAFRKKRNISSYERVGNVSDADARDMQELALRLRDDVTSWLRKHHPELM